MILKHHISRLSFAVCFPKIVDFIGIQFRCVIIPEFVFLPDKILVIKRYTGEKRIAFRIVFEKHEAKRPP
jgi:hypothetical protein